MASSITQGLIISEVELNPPDSDTGTEWVELYSSEESDLDGDYLLNGDNQRYNLTGTFSGYIIVTFSKQWLDNTNESVKLMHKGELVSETPVFKDSLNDLFSWSVCESEWTFGPSTKNVLNGCVEEKKEEKEKEELPKVVESKREDEKEIIIEELSFSTPTSEDVKEEPVQKTKILLTSKDSVEKKVEKKVYTSKEFVIQQWIVYAFAGFCVLLIILLSWRKL